MQSPHGITASAFRPSVMEETAWLHLDTSLPHKLAFRQ